MARLSFKTPHLVDASFPMTILSDGKVDLAGEKTPAAEKETIDATSVAK
jgi:hypothetical protein